MVLFTSNYIVDVLLSLFFLLLENRLSIEVSHIDVGFGIVSGIMYLVSFVLLQYNIEKNGVVQKLDVAFESEKKLENVPVFVEQAEVEAT